MIHAWYEKNRDVKDCLYFACHEGKNFGKSKNIFPAFHNSIEFAFCLEGSMEIVIGGVSHPFREGDVCFMNSREPHRYYYNNSVKCYIVLIGSSFFNDTNRLGDISFPSHMTGGEQFGVIKQYLDYAIAHWDGESILCKRAFADTFAYLMTRYYPHSPKQNMERQSEVILEAVKYICEHCTERLTVGDLATRFGYSANYFSAVFNELMGISFSDYVNTCRMIEYYQLQRDCPELSAIRAAEMCGFGSMNTFYRARNRFLSEQTAENVDQSVDTDEYKPKSKGEKL